MKALYVTDRQSAGDSRLKETLAALSGAPGPLGSAARERGARPGMPRLGQARPRHAGPGSSALRESPLRHRAGRGRRRRPPAGGRAADSDASAPALPEGFAIGVSTHSPGEAAARDRGGRRPGRDRTRSSTLLPRAPTDRRSARRRCAELPARESTPARSSRSAGSARRTWTGSTLTATGSRASPASVSSRRLREPRAVVERIAPTMKPIASVEERIPLVVRRLAGPVAARRSSSSAASPCSRRSESRRSTRAQNRELRRARRSASPSRSSSRGCSTTSSSTSRSGCGARPPRPRCCGRSWGSSIFGLCVGSPLPGDPPDVEPRPACSRPRRSSRPSSVSRSRTRSATSSPGLALHLEKTVQVGDMVRSGETFGTVEELSWRAIKLRTMEGNVAAHPQQRGEPRAPRGLPAPGAPDRADAARGPRVRPAAGAGPRGARGAPSADVPGLARVPRAGRVPEELRGLRGHLRAALLAGGLRAVPRARLAGPRAGLVRAGPGRHRRSPIPSSASTSTRRDALDTPRPAAGHRGRDRRARRSSPASPTSRGRGSRTAPGERRFAPGETIVREGDRGSSMFVIESGQRRRLDPRDARARASELAVLERGRRVRGDQPADRRAAHGDRPRR